MLRAGWVIIACGAIAPGVATAQTPNAKTVIDKATAAFTALKQYQLTLTVSGETAIKFTAERPDKFWMEMNGAASMFSANDTGGPSGSVFIAGTGKTVWSYAPQLKRYGRVTSKVSQEAADYISNAATWVTGWEEGIVGNSLSALAMPTSSPVTEETISLSGQNRPCYVVESSGVKAWIDKSTYLLDQVRTEGETMQLRFEHLNTPFPESTFVLNPAPDAIEQEMNVTRNPFH